MADLNLDDWLYAGLSRRIACCMIRNNINTFDDAIKLINDFEIHGYTAMRGVGKKTINALREALISNNTPDNATRTIFTINRAEWIMYDWIETTTQSDPLRTFIKGRERTPDEAAKSARDWDSWYPTMLHFVKCSKHGV